jgi:hypothetical protein
LQETLLKIEMLAPTKLAGLYSLSTTNNCSVIQL